MLRSARRQQNVSSSPASFWNQSRRCLERRVTDQKMASYDRLASEPEPKPKLEAKPKWASYKKLAAEASKLEPKPEPKPEPKLATKWLDMNHLASAEAEANSAEADALLDARRSLMGNLDTVLALLLGIEIALLSAVTDVEASWEKPVVVLAATLAIGWTTVGLGCAILFQMLAVKIKQGHAEKFITDTQLVDWLSFFPVLGFAFSCPCIVFSLACSVCVRYDNHWSALLAAAILVVAQLACWLACVAYNQIQRECEGDMVQPFIGAAARTRKSNRACELMKFVENLSAEHSAEPDAGRREVLLQKIVAAK